MLHGAPAMQTLGAQPSAVDPVDFSPPHSHDPPVPHADVEGAAVRAEHAGRLHPMLRLGGQGLVDPDRPVTVPLEAGPEAPNVADAVAALADRWLAVPERSPAGHAVLPCVICFSTKLGSCCSRSAGFRLTQRSL